MDINLKLQTFAWFLLLIAFIWVAYEITLIRIGLLGGRKRELDENPYGDVRELEKGDIPRLKNRKERRGSKRENPGSGRV